jgi:hypothetical protein
MMGNPSREPIPADKLSLSNVPEENADWVTISRFALTFDGYAGYPANWKLYAQTKDAFKAGRAKFDSMSLTELRTCLFHEQRLQRWSIHPTYEPQLVFMQALICAIRANLSHTSKC